VAQGRSIVGRDSDRSSAAEVTKLSIVIPTYNTASMTLRCCRAVLASMPESSEVIVVDDGSTDDTEEMLGAFPVEDRRPRLSAAAENRTGEAPVLHWRVIRLDENRGFATAANRGVAEAKGRIVLVLNSDAIVERDALRAIVAAFDADEHLGVAGARLLNEDGTPQWSGGRTPTLPWMIGVVSGAGHLARFLRRTRATPRDVDWVSGAAMAFRAEVWKPLSDRYLFYCQDIDFCLRARSEGWSVRIVEDAHIIHVLGGTVSAGSPLHYDPEKLWPDLLTWGRAHYGRTWAMFARATLIAVAALRIATRFRYHPALIRGLKAICRTPTDRAPA
jgi:GT2 family glycosyltransferase